MRILLTTASALALLAAAALAATPTTPPGAGASGATTSSSTASQSTTKPSAGATTNAMGAPGNAEPPAQTTEQSGTAASNSSKLNQVADQGFVKNAGAGNIAEVQEGKLAAQKSRNPAVQEFGRWMQTDHTMANGLLMEAAKSSNIQVPSTPNPAQMKAMQKLQKLNGAQFNRQYINGAVMDHEKTIKLFQNEAQNGQNASLKTYANAMLPALQAHLQEAQALQSNMSRRTASGAGGSTATGNTAVGAGNAGTARLNQQELNKIQHR